MNDKLYILKLNHGKWYVGKSKNPDKRFKQHKNGIGSAWTKKYPPIQIEQIIENIDEFDEDKYTKIFMNKYGIDNVRGGTFSSINIDMHMDTLKKELNHSNNKCFNCGEEGHYANDCWVLIEKSYDKYDSNNASIFVRAIDIFEKLIFEECTRCGRQNHSYCYCYAKRHIDGYFLD